jgi:hypothetical protein
VVLEDPLWQDGNDYPARLDRQFIEDVFDVEGVIKPSTGALLVAPRAAGANMSVDVAAGRAVIKGDDEANQGSYRVISTATENLPIGARPGSDSRIDLVVARVRDAAVTGGVSSDWILEVIPGTVAAAPVVPAVPATAIPLAEITVTSATLSITATEITKDRRSAAQNAAYEPKQLIAETILGAGGNVLLNNIPQTFRHLQLVCYLRGARSAAADGVVVQLNGDTTANYDWQKSEAFGTTLTASEGIAATGMNLGGMTAATGPGSVPSPLVIDIPDYSRATWQKAVRARGGYKSANTSGSVVLTDAVGFQRSLTAITSISVLGNIGVLAAQSVVSLYGIKGA